MGQCPDSTRRRSEHTCCFTSVLGQSKRHSHQFIGFIWDLVGGGSRQERTGLEIVSPDSKKNWMDEFSVSVERHCLPFPYYCCHRPEKEPQFKFIYFNHMNLAEKSTIHMRKTASVSLTSVHPDLMKILGDINCDFARYFARQRGFNPRLAASVEIADQKGAEKMD